MACVSDDQKTLDLTNVGRTILRWPSDECKGMLSASKAYAADSIVGVPLSDGRRLLVVQQCKMQGRMHSRALVLALAKLADVRES